MIHLFKKVYLASDSQISLEYDRVVISEENGFPLRKAAQEVYQGELLNYAQRSEDIVNKIGSWDRLFSLADEQTSRTKKSVMIYCDDKALVEVLVVWFKNLLPHADKPALESLIRGMLFRYNVFFKGKFIVERDRPELGHEVTDAMLDAAFEKYSAVVIDYHHQVLPNVSIEFLLSTYLSTGQLKDHLKESMKVLIRKDIEKYLLEVKEIFFTHLNTRRFVRKMKYDKEYTYDNITDILTETHQIPQLFLSERLWNYKYMSHPSSTSPTAKIDAFTPADIEVLNQFVEFATASWGEEGVYVGPKSDATKMEFVSIFTDFTDEMLTKIIDVESTFEHAAGSFFATSLTSVDNYFITEILERYKINDTNWIRRYSII